MQALISAFQENPSFEQLNNRINRNLLPTHAWGLDKRIAPLLMESVERKNPLRLIIAQDEARAKELVEDYSLYDRETYYYPAKDVLFYHADVHSNQTVQGRLEIIKRISEGKRTTIITTIDGLMDKLPEISCAIESVVTIKVGNVISIKDLSKKLTSLGFEKISMVESPGQFSVRGGIVDIYPLTEECPYRIEFWGDDVDSIRSFDAESQRSIENVKELSIFPSCEMVLTEKRISKGIEKIEAEHKVQAKKLKEAFHTEQYARLNKMVENVKEELQEFNSTFGLDSFVEYFYDKTVSFLDYIPEDSEIFIVEPEKVYRHACEYSLIFQDSMKGRLEGGYVLPGQVSVLYDAKEIVGRLANRRIIMVSDLYRRQTTWNEQSEVCFSAKGLLNYNNSFEKLMSDISDWKKKGYRVVILSPSATRGKRIAKNLTENDITASFTENKKKVATPGEVMVSTGRIASGFVIPDSKLAVISETDIFEIKETKKKPKPIYHGERIRSFDDISFGDYVVHEKHGVGIYRGIEKVETDGRLKDYIAIEYDKGSKLFVPVEQLDVIGKLSGKEGTKPKLNRLGGAEWDKVRSRVKGHVTAIAQELVDLYAIRETTKGFEYGPDTTWQTEFEELFPYDETEDQKKAIDDTKKDMESTKVMDRLVCGDVGFGKTEVAIRAAFKAVQDSRQVAYLVPTTILAEQHYNTFCDRMKNFPVNVRMLSRFCTPKEIKDTLKGLKDGTVDVVIGTHRLLSKDVEYKSLGLLIIDEEQRFGVKHKEQIKQMKKNIDVLTLTATPIPRTLHMSLVGLRDISLLEEPPVDRLPIQTYVMEYDLQLVKEAIKRELSRNGQAYYVYNRVNNIDQIAAGIKTVLPEARIEYAHGKMGERELEDIMHRFIKHEIDVLVSTTIIETGLDIPNVNTIIIHDADNFGLSQLYQLRGRVGRSNRSAYAFLMYRRDKMITEVAEKRLQAIREFTDLGSGYKISMKDLEIRGAGNLLGESQSGNIEAVGYDLYCKMLNDAIKRLTGQEIVEEFVTSIEIPVDAYIPDTYIKNEFMKLDMYKQISRSDSREKNDLIVEEARDRYGEPPKSFFRLLDVAYLKSIAHKAFITDVKYINGELRFVMLQTAPVHPERMDTLLKRYKGDLKFETGKNSVYFKIKASKTIQEELIQTAENVIIDIQLLTDKNYVEPPKEEKKDVKRFKKKQDS